MARYNLAQLNIAKMKYAIDDPAMQDFVDQLDPVNESADNSPGFVWRLQTGEGDATDVRIYDDEYLLVNLSVWESIEALKAFVASQRHGAVMRRRTEWFDRMDEAYLVMWWVPEHHRPSIQEAQDKLDMLRKLGPTPAAFDWSNPYSTPE